MKYTPKKLLELRIKNARESRGINNFSGIYIIHNRVKDIYEEVLHQCLFMELGLPHNLSFISNFYDMITAYRKTKKK